MNQVFAAYRSKLWLLFGCVGFTLTTFLVAYVLYDFLKFETNIKVSTRQCSHVLHTHHT